MSSTMQAWRTALNVPSNQTYNAIKAVLDSITGYWSSPSANAPAGNTDYYVSDNFFLRINSGGMAIYKGGVYGNSNITFGSYNNLTVYKSGDCVIICPSFKSSATSEYSAEAKYIIDKTGSGAGSTIIHTVSASDGYCKLFDNSNSAEMTVYSPYNDTYSLNPNTTFAQIAPFHNSALNKKFDTLYGVLLAPKMNEFVDINGVKWLFTNGFAVSAGNEVPTPVIPS